MSDPTPQTDPTTKTDACCASGQKCGSRGNAIKLLVVVVLLGAAGFIGYKNLQKKGDGLPFGGIVTEQGDIEPDDQMPRNPNFVEDEYSQRPPAADNL